MLLRPQSKKKTVPIPEAPPHLQDLVLPTIPAENCAWSLSGPQFPINNKAGSLQQRYCYPKGRPEYSSYKGGALWTIRGPDGKEENEYRLLHVYQSQKRAANKGVTLGAAHRAMTDLRHDCNHYQHISKRTRYISPARERPSIQTKISLPSIHRINSCGTLDTTLSFSSLEQSFSNSFESFPGIGKNHVARPASPIISGRNAANELSGANELSPTVKGSTSRQEQIDHDFHFQDLHNDPLLQVMEQHSNETRFVQRLEIVHEKVRKYIFDQPQHLQSSLVCTLATWARALAADPLWARANSKSKDRNEDFDQEYGQRACC